GYSLNFGLKKRPEILGDSIPFDVSLIGCGIAMSGANNPDPGYCEDNLLSAREICNLDLSNVDFVILSACQTAKGDIYDEGTAGLIRGLKNAGVKTVLATLWEVDDLATMRFMQEFYHQLSKGVSKYEAYRGAQQVLRDNNMDEPYYWAPFILIDSLD
ncbi:MAG: CHAT domain-containing protein, partial [Allobaculum sp.]|nr:CHAT domain-containing protein [Allobaculum sp.]